MPHRTQVFSAGRGTRLAEDYPPRLGGHAPVNWAIFFTWIVTLVRRASIRTVPQALRLWANQVDDVFSFLVRKHPALKRGLGDSDLRINSNGLVCTR